MNLLRLISSIALCSLFSASFVYSTHNRAGEITYSQTGPLTILATVTTYTKTSSSGADRDSLTILWGDGTMQVFLRNNGAGEEIPGEDIKVNYYIKEHTYPGRGTYTISFQDPNRVNNIQNVNYPNSVDVPFFVETKFTLVESQFQGPNNSVVLLQPPIDFACVGKKFVHNPNAYDPDGDSISYELTIPLQSHGMDVPIYVFPDDLPGSNSTLFINPVTGDLVWNAPSIAGEYNVAFKINEYRDGVLLNSVIRDMQILVLACEDNPPEVEVEKEICVVAGTSIRIPVTVMDIDSGQLVRVSATGGPFEQDISPGFLSNQNNYSASPLTSFFTWDTKCEHISDAYYQVVFRGQDDSRQGVNGNSVLSNLRIKVVGPPPENLEAKVIDEKKVELTWDRPYACENTLDESFIGFRVYRREGANPFAIDTCQNGLEGQGYEVIKFLTNATQGSDKYFYEDETIEKGKIYCYRVLANFAQRTTTGQPFRIVESLPSEEVCIQLKQDLPLITEVSVSETSDNNGSIAITWLNPIAKDVDTISNTGPYRYVLSRSIDGSIYTEIQTYNSEFFGSIETQSFEDSGLNTIDNQYLYLVDFYTKDGLFSSSFPASSVYSIIESTDKSISVICSAEVPWKNYNYTLEQIDPITLESTILESSKTCQFTQTDLLNNQEYCYRIATLGTYGLGGRSDSLLNYSQIVCGIPLDTVGPCPPVISVNNPCNLSEEPGEEIDYINRVSWVGSEVFCSDGDLESYNIYYAGDSSLTDLILIGQVKEGEPYRLDHLPELGISGCYSIAAVDSLDNEGALSNIVCVENCPIYELPNTFTPNGDGSNDMFYPRENRFVAQIDFKVFNRWGNLLFETNDPEINWDGKSSSGKQIPEGTYYYTCNVFEQGPRNGLSEVEFFHGYIQLLR